MIQPMQNAGAEAIRQSQVEEQISALEVNALDLQHIVNALEVRLRSVMRPLAESSQNKPSPVPTPVMVPLADKMSNIANSIRGSVDRVREIIAATELTE